VLHEHRYTPAMHKCILVASFHFPTYLVCTSNVHKLYSEASGQYVR